MSYPNVIYGDYGDEKAVAASAIGGLPLGQLMILPDGRKFRHAQCGSAASISAGILLSTSAGVVNHGALGSSAMLASATTTYNQVGDTDVYVASNTVTAMTLNQYADGHLNVQSGSGAGRNYKVKANASAPTGTSLSLKIALYPEDPLKVAFAAGTTAVSLRKSPYKDAIIMSSSAVIAPPMGVSCAAAAVSYYFWVQRTGPASVQTSATTVTDGTPVMCSTVTSGSITVIAAASAGASVDRRPIGVAMEAPAAAAWGLVDLMLE